MPKSKKQPKAELFSCYRYTNKSGLTVLFQLEKLLPRMEAKAIIFTSAYPPVITLGDVGCSFEHLYLPAPHEVEEGTEITYSQFLAAWTLATR